MLSNWDKWQSYTSNLSSPQNYIDWGFLYMISASLQRRVWIGNDLFPNMYIFFVGAPGIGKGLVIKEVSKFLKHWKKSDAIKINGDKLDSTEQLAEQSFIEADLKRAQEFELQGRAKGSDTSIPLLIPLAADATTYEALVKAHAESYSRILVPVYSEKSQKMIVRPHGHSSIAFCLSELSSLLRKRTDDTVNYIMNLYDCPEDYEYITKHEGKDRVRRGCINLLAGTQPAFLSKTFDDRLFDEGMSSRLFFVFAHKNRKNQVRIPAPNAEQLSHKMDILNHIRQLTNLYGEVHVDEDVWQWFERWWDEFATNMNKRANKNPKLIPYYGRMNIHPQKVAMAHHFGESLEMHLDKEDFEWAIDFLETEAKNMHLAINLEGNSPMSKISRKVLDILTREEEQSVVDLMIATHHLCTHPSDLEDALSYLRDTGQITDSLKNDEITEKQIVYWKIKK